MLGLGVNLLSKDGAISILLDEFPRLLTTFNSKGKKLQLFIL